MDPERRFLVSSDQRTIYFQIFSILCRNLGAQSWSEYFTYTQCLTESLTRISWDLTLGVTTSLVCPLASVIFLALQWGYFSGIFRSFQCGKSSETSCVFWLCICFSSELGGLTCWFLNTGEHRNHLGYVSKCSHGHPSPSPQHTYTVCLGEVWGFAFNKYPFGHTSEASSKQVYFDKEVEYQ